jgi:hypothetical protein
LLPVEVFLVTETALLDAFLALGLQPGCGRPATKGAFFGLLPRQVR